MSVRQKQGRCTLHQRHAPGSASLEFAGATFALLLTLVFILHAGIVMVTMVTATNAAREGARAAVTLPPGDPVAAATQASPGFARQIDVQGGSDSVKVTVRLKTPLVSPAIAGWDWWLTSSATMRRER